MILSDSKLKEYYRQEVNTEWKERLFIREIRNYIKSDLKKVLLIGGLKGTGKTVGILQSIPLDDTLFIFPDFKNAIAAEGVKCLLQNNTKSVIVVDSFSWIDGYGDLASVLHGFVQQGKRVIISGAKSVSLEYLKYDKLIHRVKIIHTTYISFDEFCEVFDREQNYDSCIEYLKTGGLFKDCAMDSFHSMKKYVNEAIVDNVSSYVRELTPELIKATIYSIFYYSVCNSISDKVFTFHYRRKSQEEFLEGVGLDPAIVIRQQDFDEVLEIMSIAGIIIKVEDLRLRSKYKVYIVNPSIAYQLIKFIYDLQEIPTIVFNCLHESSCVCWLSTLVDDSLKFGYLEGRNLEEIFALYDRKSAYLFQCILGENTQLTKEASLVGSTIERVLVGKRVLGRFVVYNGSEKAEVLNGKEIIYTSDYVKLAILNTAVFA